uniref:Uncharacterized protein LOC105132766 n=1 Tax=Rhizophora mucronata TaxID=61149 RepID=A0A2P2M593_RHIMU
MVMLFHCNLGLQVLVAETIFFIKTRVRLHIFDPSLDLMVWEPCPLGHPFYSILNAMFAFFCEWL